jgi:hypothetical protein
LGGRDIDDGLSGGGLSIDDVALRISDLLLHFGGEIE